MTALAKYNLSASDGTTSLNALGQEINIKGATWMYVLASTTITAFQACIVTRATMTIQPLTTALAASVGAVADIVIPQFDFASGEYGYAAVGPFNLREDNSTTFKVSALTLAVAGAKMYTTATAGSIDDTATTLIAGLTLNTTVGGSTANTACFATTRLQVGVV
tara:strand:+ start:443 stop:934 length:492 start_codon:yes stop_codon:yes gene_type:complete